MVNLFPYVTIRHQADDVPTTVVNGVKTLVGACDETEAVDKILAASGSGANSYACMII